MITLMKEYIDTDNNMVRPTSIGIKEEFSYNRSIKHIEKEYKLEIPLYVIQKINPRSRVSHKFIP